MVRDTNESQLGLPDKPAINKQRRAWNDAVKDLLKEGVVYCVLDHTDKYFLGDDYEGTWRIVELGPWSSVTKT